MKRFIDCWVPIETCNFKCHYCYIAQLDNFKNKIPKFDYTAEIIAKALSKERLGGTCLINLCAGGETLLVPTIVDVIEAILREGHYVMVVTNGSINKQFDKIVKLPKMLLQRLFFKFSYHYLELKRLNKMKDFFDNINKIRMAGCSFTLEITPNDEIIPYIDDIKREAIKNVGAVCHCTIARNDTDKNISILSKYSFDEYKKIWKTFSSELFDFKLKMYQRKINEFCYAGEWSAWVNLGTGELKQCYAGLVLDNIYRDLDKPLHFLAVGRNCKLAYCYNAHVFLSLGDVPELITPTYAMLRNRECDNNTEWLTSEFKKIFSKKLVDSNIEYTEDEKGKIDKKNKKLILKNRLKLINILRAVKKRMKKLVF